MLYVRAPRGEREAYIRHRRAGQYADVLLLGKMREDEPLPAAVKLVLRAAARKLYPAAARQRLKQQMHLGIVAQRLEMPDALDRVLYRLAVHDAPGVERDVRVEALFYKAAEYLGLHPAHELHAYLSCAFVPDDVQLRILLIELH